jgi:hypothetical protein
LSVAVEEMEFNFFCKVVKIAIMGDVAGEQVVLEQERISFALKRKRGVLIAS